MTPVLSLLSLSSAAWAVDDCIPGTYTLTGASMVGAVGVGVLAFVVALVLGRPRSTRQLLGTGLGAGLAALAAIMVLSLSKPCPEVPAPAERHTAMNAP